MQRGFIQYDSGLKPKRVNAIEYSIPIAQNGYQILVMGIPEYFDTDQLASLPCAAYGLTDSGWYVFLSITAPYGICVKNGFSIVGASSHIVPYVGDKCVSVAIRFPVAAQTICASICWDGLFTEAFHVSANDLAIRNLDLRATFYMYDVDTGTVYTCGTYTWEPTPDTIFGNKRFYYTRSGTGLENDPYVYTRAVIGTDYEIDGYSLTTDVSFLEGGAYYTRSGEDGAYTYTQGVAGTDYTVGDVIPAGVWYIAGHYIPPNTYYSHATLRLTGWVQNVTYQMPIVDCPVTIDLPEVQGDHHYGSWFEMRFIMPTAKSITLVPVAGVYVSGALGLAPGAGKNVLSMQYFPAAEEMQALGYHHEWRQVTTTWGAPTGQ